MTPWYYVAAAVLLLYSVGSSDGLLGSGKTWVEIQRSRDALAADVLGATGDTEGQWI